jgi:hypothetical protein
LLFFFPVVFKIIFITSLTANFILLVLKFLFIEVSKFFEIKGTCVPFNFTDWMILKLLFGLNVRNLYIRSNLRVTFNRIVLYTDD